MNSMHRRSFFLLPLAALGQTTQPPRKSPDIAVTLPSGKQIKVSEYAGKVLAVSFIVTT
jgi:hypothetical protein